MPPSGWCHAGGGGARTWQPVAAWFSLGKDRASKRVGTALESSERCVLEVVCAAAGKRGLREAAAAKVLGPKEWEEGTESLPASKLSCWDPSTYLLTNLVVPARLATVTATVADGSNKTSSLQRPLRRRVLGAGYRGHFPAATRSPVSLDMNAHAEYSPRVLRRSEPV